MGIVYFEFPGPGKGCKIILKNWTDKHVSEKDNEEIGSMTIEFVDNVSTEQKNLHIDKDVHITYELIKNVNGTIDSIVVDIMFEVCCKIFEQKGLGLAYQVSESVGVAQTNWDNGTHVFNQDSYNRHTSMYTFLQSEYQKLYQNQSMKTHVVSRLLKQYIDESIKKQVNHDLLSFVNQSKLVELYDRLGFEAMDVHIDGFEEVFMVTYEKTKKADVDQPRFIQENPQPTPQHPSAFVFGLSRRAPSIQLV